MYKFQVNTSKNKNFFFFFGGGGALGARDWTAVNIKS